MSEIGHARSRSSVHVPSYSPEANSAVVFQPVLATSSYSMSTWKLMFAETVGKIRIEHLCVCGLEEVGGTSGFSQSATDMNFRMSRKIATDREPYGLAAAGPDTRSKSTSRGRLTKRSH
jgi:hypothetical protein